MIRKILGVHQLMQICRNPGSRFDGNLYANGVAGRNNIVLLLSTLVLSGLLLTTNAIAGDGDVDYSAPYIMVDPQTGKLVTVNPGPELRMHSEASADQTTMTPAGSDATMATLPGSGNLSPSLEPEPGGSMVIPIIIAIMASVVIGVVMLIRKRKQKQAL